MTKRELFHRYTLFTFEDFLKRYFIRQNYQYRIYIIRSCYIPAPIRFENSCCRVNQWITMCYFLRYLRPEYRVLKCNARAAWSKMRNMLCYCIDISIYIRFLWKILRISLWSATVLFFIKIKKMCSTNIVIFSAFRCKTHNTRHCWKKMFIFFIFVNHTFTAIRLI